MVDLDSLNFIDNMVIGFNLAYCRLVGTWLIISRNFLGNLNWFIYLIKAKVRIDLVKQNLVNFNNLVGFGIILG